MSEPNKAVLQRHFDELWSQGNLAVVDELFASDCLAHTSLAEFEGREEMKHYVATVRRAFPDLQFCVEDVMAEGDRVAARWTARPTPAGESPAINGNLPPPRIDLALGRQAHMMGISIYRIADGKVVECWTLYSTR